MSPGSRAVVIANSIVIARFASSKLPTSEHIGLETILVDNSSSTHNVIGTKKWEIPSAALEETANGTIPTE